MSCVWSRRGFDRAVHIGAAEQVKFPLRLPVRLQVHEHDVGLHVIEVEPVHALKSAHRSADEQPGVGRWPHP